MEIAKVITNFLNRLNVESVNNSQIIHNVIKYFSIFYKVK
jgi:hypothetical protein